MDKLTEYKEFMKTVPNFLYPVCCDDDTVEDAKWHILLEMDFYTDEPISERANCFIKTKKQYEKAKKLIGGVHKS